MLKTIKNIAVGFLGCIIFLLLLGVFVWQYDLYKQELSYFKREISWYEQIYVNDVLQLNEMPIGYLEMQLTKINDDIYEVNQFLPISDLAHDYNFIDIIKDKSGQFGVLCNVLAISKENEDFYTALSVNVEFTGEFTVIKKVLSEIENNPRIVSCASIHINRPQTAGMNTAVVDVQLKIFSAYSEPKRETRTGSHENVMNIETWLPPYSFKLIPLRDKMKRLKQDADKRLEFNDKLALDRSLRKQTRLYNALQNITNDLKLKRVSLSLCLSNMNTEKGL